MAERGSGVYNVEANTVDVAITDTDGTEWLFELVASDGRPIDLSVKVEQEALEGPPSGAFRAFVSGPTHASVKVRGRLRARSAPSSEPA